MAAATLIQKYYAITVYRCGIRLSRDSKKVSSPYYSKLPYPVSIQTCGRYRVATKDWYDPAYEAVLQRLVARRKERGLTQVDIASVMKTDQSQISKFERRERRLDLIDFVRYCIAVDLDPTVLVRTVESLLRKR